MNMQVKPLGDRILAKEVETEQVTKSGIIIPATAEKKSGIYEVVAIGDGEQAKQYKIGDKIVVEKYQGVDFKNHDDKDTDYKIFYVGKEKTESSVAGRIE